MRIIDAHAHIASWPNVPACASNLLEGMARHGVEKVLVSHADCTSFPGEHEAQVTPLTASEGLRQVLDLCKAHPGKIYAAAWFTPLREETPSDELIRLIKENLTYVKALKLHPFCERIAADDPRLEPYYDLAREFDLPILVHTAVDPDSAIYHLVNAAKNHPDLRFVAAHLELCSDHRFAIDNVADMPNIYADTAWVDIESARVAIERMGEDRLLFGTDAPIDGADTLDNPMYLAYFRNELGFGEETYGKLMAGNAIALYRLD